MEESIGLGQDGKKLFVVPRDDCRHIRHTPIADFNIVFIEYLMEPIMSGKMLCD